MPKGATIEKAPPATRARANTRPRRASLIPLADSYLLWSVVGSTLRGLGWFVGLFLAFAIVTGARTVSQKGIPIALAFEGVALQMPRIVLFTIPASLLFGVVSTFTEMSSKGEITALMAGGMGLRRMLRGPLLLAFGLGLFAFWLQEVVVPGAELAKSDLLRRAANTISIKDGFNFTKKRSNGTVESLWQADSFDASKRLLTKPVVQFFREDNTVSKEIKADSAIWDEQSNVWILKNSFTRVNPEQVGERSKPGDPMSVGVHADEATIETNQSPSPSSFKGAAGGARDNLEDRNFEMLSWRQLAAYRDEQRVVFSKTQGKEHKKARTEIRAATFGIHDKWATPLVVMAMVLFGAPLGVRPQRTASAGLAMGLSLMVIMGYYLLWTLCTQAGKGGVAVPQLLAYLPTIVLTTLGTILIARKS